MDSKHWFQTITNEKQLYGAWPFVWGQNLMEKCDSGSTVWIKGIQNLTILGHQSKLKKTTRRRLRRRPPGAAAPGGCCFFYVFLCVSWFFCDFFVFSMFFFVFSCFSLYFYVFLCFFSMRFKPALYKPFPGLQVKGKFPIRIQWNFIKI